MVHETPIETYTYVVNDKSQLGREMLYQGISTQKDRDIVNITNT